MRRGQSEECRCGCGSSVARKEGLAAVEGPTCHARLVRVPSLLRRRVAKQLEDAMLESAQIEAPVETLARGDKTFANCAPTHLVGTECRGGSIGPWPFLCGRREQAGRAGAQSATWSFVCACFSVRGDLEVRFCMLERMQLAIRQYCTDLR